MWPSLLSIFIILYCSELLKWNNVCRPADVQRLQPSGGSFSIPSLTKETNRHLDIFKLRASTLCAARFTNVRIIVILAGITNTWGNSSQIWCFRVGQVAFEARWKPILLSCRAAWSLWGPETKPRRFSCATQESLCSFTHLAKQGKD